MKSNLGNWMLAAAVCLSANTWAADGGKTGAAKPAPPRKFIDPANMDPAIKPGDNFFLYANGGWLKRNSIPAKETRWGSFGILAEDNNKKLIAILQNVSRSTNHPKGSLEQRVGDLYASGMDSLTIEKAGYTPIKADLQRVDAIKNLDGVISEIVYQRTVGEGSPLFGFGVRQDPKHVTKYVVGLNQGGTSLPDRDYYLVNNARNEKVRGAYKTYLTTLFSLTGTSEAQADKDAATIIRMETELARLQMSRVEMRDPNKSYNKFSVSEFSKTTPHLDWAVLMPEMKVRGQDTLLVGQPAFFKSIDGMLASVPVEDWKVYLKGYILRDAAGRLSSPFVQASFKFSSVQSGQQVQAPREQRMTQMVDRSMGQLLGQLYVKEYFPQSAKVYMNNLVDNMRQTFAERIQRLEWMSPETKKRALIKLNAITKKIGFPDKWENYDGVTIARNDYYGNLKRLSIYGYNDMVTRLGKPVDKTRWGFTTPTVNASYSPTGNEITFPAGILQFPFFNKDADDAVNYGGIAAVIGHEMTHGFDDQGRQYDADGTLRDWWGKEDADKFKVRADMVVNQYNQFTVLDTIHVNGRLTLGENLADLGGLNIAYQAFKKTPEGHSTTKIDGFTPDQRFFLSWAQVWRSLQRPESASSRILTDPHSPEEYRTNAPITNIDAWYAAFDVKPGDKMYKKPEDRIHVW